MVAVVLVVGWRGGGGRGGFFAGVGAVAGAGSGGGGDGGEGVGVGFAAVVEKIARLWAQVGRACTLR